MRRLRGSAQGREQGRDASPSMWVIRTGCFGRRRRKMRPSGSSSSFLGPERLAPALSRPPGPLARVDDLEGLRKPPFRHVQSSGVGSRPRADHLFEVLGLGQLTLVTA